MCPTQAEPRMLLLLTAFGGFSIVSAIELLTTVNETIQRERS